jgi:site-specific recombinase XerD
MIIKAYLADFVRQDGQARVMIYAYDPKTRTKVRIPTDIYVSASDWDGSLVKKGVPHAQFLNPKIKRKILDLEEFALKHPHMSARELLAAHRYTGPALTPVTYFRHYIDLAKKGEIVHKITKEKLAGGYLKAMGTSAGHLELFAKRHRVDWELLGEDFFDRYVNFLRGLEFKQNTIAKSITHLLTITRHAKKKGLHDNDVEYSIQKEKTQKIRLTPDEVQRIIEINISDWPELQDEWERFQVAYNLILRFGDTISINEKNIIQRGDKHFLTAFTGKGKKEILLPLKNNVYQILKRNKFKMKGTNAKSNEKLKKLGMHAGINDKVTFTEFRAGKKTEVQYKKYQKIETHTTRRSAARNLFDSGMPPEIIMTLGGWTNMKQLLEYIDIDLDYAAGKAAEHPFFK